MQKPYKAYKIRSAGAVAGSQSRRASGNKASSMVHVARCKAHVAWCMAAGSQSRRASGTTASSSSKTASCISSCVDFRMKEGHALMSANSHKHRMRHSRKRKSADAVPADVLAKLAVCRIHRTDQAARRVPIHHD